MEYKRNIYLFLIFDFLTNLSPLSFIYALFLKQQNMSLTQIGFIISAYQISKLIFEIPSGVFSDKYGRKTCNVIKLRNGIFEGNTKNVLPFFCRKFEFFCRKFEFFC